MCDQIRNLGHKSECRALLAVAARFAALRNDHIGAALQGSFGIAPGLDLAHQRHAALSDAFGEGCGIVERQQNRLRMLRKRQVEQRRLFA